MKFIFDLLMLASLKRAFNLFYGLVTSYFLGFYIRIIEGCRKIFTAMIMIILSLMLMLAGFLIIHAALFMYLPFALETKTLIFLILGVCYLFAPLTIIFCLNSKRSWLKMSGVEEILKNIDSQKK